MSEPFVLDASVAAAWLFHDERSVETEALRGDAEQSYVVVPAIFSVELQNILWTGEVRRRLTPGQSDAFWNWLGELEIRVQPAAAIRSSALLLELSRRFALSAYDTSYLKLAQSTGFALATLDMRLRAATIGAGLQVVPR